MATIMDLITVILLKVGSIAEIADLTAVISSDTPVIIAII
jgi:hypothetical protein